MMINQDTACMFACCYDNKGGHLPAHSAKAAIFQQVRVGTDFASFFSREREGKISSTLVLADMACWAGTARVSNFIIITSGKHAAPVFVYHHLPVAPYVFPASTATDTRVASWGSFHSHLVENSSQQIGTQETCQCNILYFLRFKKVGTLYHNLW